MSYEYLPSPKPLNGKQFSQMPLFTAKPTDEHRWPRGYTPERKAEVNANIRDVTVAEHVKPAPGSRFKAPWELAKPTQSMTRGRSNAAQQARSVIVDTVARSTAPAEDLQGARFEVAPIKSGASGDYQANNNLTQWTGGRVRLDPSTGGGHKLNERTQKYDRTSPVADQEHTLLHELGHHDDHMSDPDTFRATTMNRRWGGSWPALEGAAEGYAFKHHQPERGETLDRSALRSYRNMDGRKAFREAFQRVSGEPVSASREPLTVRRQEPPVSGHPRLFGRNASSDETNAPGYQDYGQHPLVDHTDVEEAEYPSGKKYARTNEKPLNTIKLGRGVRARK